MPGTNPIGLLSTPDLPRVLELAHLAGWNQTLPDLERMLCFAPESCFGLWTDSGLVSTAMAFPYGADLGWVAMVLTHPDERGKGYAGTLTGHAIEWLRDRRTAWLKLDASPLGQPIYERLGFAFESRMERYLLSPETPRPTAMLSRREFPTSPLPFEFDLEAFGADRRRLLDLLLRIPNLQVAVLPGNEGYAMLRPGARAWQLGPMVCRSHSAADQLLEWALQAKPGEALQWDLNTDNQYAVTLANQHGFVSMRTLSRMRLAGVANPPGATGNTAQVYAIGGFDFG